MRNYDAVQGLSRSFVSILRLCVVVRPGPAPPLAEPHHHTWTPPSPSTLSLVSLTSVSNDSSLAQPHQHPLVCQADEAPEVLDWYVGI